MKIFCVIVTIFLAVLIYADDVFSQTPASGDTTKERLQEIESRTSTSSNNTATSSATRSASTITFVAGSVTTLNSPNLIITTEAGSKLIHTTDNTRFYSLEAGVQKLIGFGDLKALDQIMVIGLSPNSVNGSAKLVVRDNSTATKTFAQIGRLKEIGTNTLTISSFSNSSVSPFIVSFSSNTLVSNGKNSTLAAADLQTGDPLIVAGLIDSKNTLITREVYRLTQEPKAKLSTNSATTSAN